MSAPAPTPTTVAQLADVVRDALAARYAAVVLRVEEDVLRVPDGKALGIAREALAGNGVDPDAATQLVQPIDLDALAWHAVPATGLDLWRQHGEAAELVTQLEAGDPPVRIVAEWEGWQLARTLDGATGWIAPAAGDVPLALECASAPDPAALAARTLDSDAFVAAAERLLGAHYHWGGTTAAGLDCSGLTQRAAWRAGGPWLPRHSTALLQAGTRVAPSKVARGDVLVLQRRADAPADRDDGFPAHRSGPAHAMHVAIAESATSTLHASRDAWEVVREPLADLLTRYRVRGVRRIAR